MKREMLEVVNARPPIYDMIVLALPRAADPGVMFAYDGKVYFPGGRGPLTRELDAHERVHIERQRPDPNGWWKKYIEDSEFRYIEEVLAHQEEYRTYCRRHANPIKRWQALRAIARRLASGLYDAGVTMEKATYDVQFWPGDHVEMGAA